MYDSTKLNWEGIILIHFFIVKVNCNIQVKDRKCVKNRLPEELGALQEEELKNIFRGAALGGKSKAHNEASVLLLEILGLKGFLTYLTITEKNQKQKTQKTKTYCAEK